MLRLFCTISVLSIILLSGCGGGGGDTEPTVPNSNNSPEITKVSIIEVQENTIEVMKVNVGSNEQTLSFSLDNTLADSALLTINSAGVLQFRSAPDFENALDENADNIYETRISVSNDSQSTTFDLSIVVIDVPPDTPANSAPVILNGNRLKVAENTTQVVNIIATDKEEEAITITIGGSDEADFDISSEGVLSFAVPPNYESPRDSNNDNIYEISISVSDGSLSSTNNIFVEVLDENDAPTIVSRNEVNTYENNTFVQQIDVVDEDGDITLSYQVSGADRNLFTVSNTGVLRFIDAPSYDDTHVNNTFNITLTVDDGGLSSEQALRVHLIKHIVIPDTSFGEVDSINLNQRLGYTNSNIQSMDRIEDSALTNDKKLVVVGGNREGGINYVDLIIWRYTSDGLLDTDLETGFGPVDPNNSNKRLGYSTGHNTVNGGGWEQVKAVDITSDNKIVIVGYIKSASGARRSAVWRFTADGFLDTGFGDVDRNNVGQRLGYTLLPYGSNADRLNDVILTGDDSILATGTRGLRPTIGSSVDDMILWKLTPIGEPDTTFGLTDPDDPTIRRGYVVRNGLGRNINEPEVYDTGSFIELTDTGNIIVLGGTGGSGLIVWHYSSSGARGATYLLRDKLHYSSARSFTLSNAIGMKKTPDNKILILARMRPYSGNIPTREILIRLTAEGALDDSPSTGFGPVDPDINNIHSLRMGYNDQLLDSSGITTVAADLAVLPDNKIIVAAYGNYQSENRSDTMLLRYSENGFLEGYDYHRMQANTPEEFTSALVLDNDRIIITGRAQYIAGQPYINKIFVKSFVQIP
ncbi:MAG: hypothetical protein OEZ68_06460 [Gammaproteobacteria bacterium]|nr:hypothetical protein [Gammaproteobacteria bacterium]MDH5800433.1 hypothetical protein [Gammaproteobacteria bacterium]